MDMEGVAGPSGGRIPSSEGLKLQMSEKKFEEMFRRRELERQDELEQIKSLGKVDSLKDLLDRRLGRNLTLKLSRGPLEKRNRKLSKSHSLKRRKLKQSVHLHKSVVGHEAVGQEAMEHGNRHTASVYQKIVLDQQQELKDIEELSIVRRRSTREAISHHVARLCNHRVTILPSNASKSGGRRMDRKKSSVLVTSVEEDEQYVRDLHRQQSRAFIQTMIQCPSRQQRVLEKLSSEQMRKISIAEQTKLRNRRRSKEIMEDISFRQSSPPPPPPPPPPSNGVEDQLSPPPPPLPASGQPMLSSASDRYSLLVGCTGGGSYSASTDIQGDGPSHEDESAGDVGDGDGVDSDDESAESAEDDFDGSVMDDHIMTLIEESSAERQSGEVQVVRLDEREFEAAHTATSIMECNISPECCEKAVDFSPIVSHSDPVPQDHVDSQAGPSMLPYFEDETLSWAESSQEGSQFSLDSQSPLRMSHSSPQFPLSMPGATPCLLSSLSGRVTGPTAVHGTYGKVDVDFNPFASEFKLGPRPEDSVSKVPHFSSVNRLSASGSASRRLKLSRNLFSPTACLSPQDSGKKTIPYKALQDDGFLLFIKELGREPEVGDYVTYKMRVIGDEIEKKYGRELNRAMDEVFYEVVKHNLSWNTFKVVSRRLLVCGARIQDSILLVPCFARRLVDVVPQLGEKIANYTEEVLDNYATESILGMGGWSSFMESYEDVEVGEEFVGLGTAVDPVYEQPKVRSPDAGPYATLPARRKPIPPKAQTIDILMSAEEVSVTQSLSHHHTKPRPPLTLRRCNSVEVLFPEEEEEEEEEDGRGGNSSSLHPQPFLKNIYSRSVSMNSLDLATPSLNPRLAAVNYNRTDSRSSTVVTRFGLSPLPEEETRTVSRRSSISSITLAGFVGVEITTTTDGGFEVIGRQANQEDSKDKEYATSSYSSSSPGRTDSTSSSTSEGEHRQRRRRRSSADIVAPLVAIATHAVAFTCYIFNQ